LKIYFLFIFYPSKILSYFRRAGTCLYQQGKLTPRKEAKLPRGTPSKEAKLPRGTLYQNKNKSHPISINQVTKKNKIKLNKTDQTRENITSRKYK
jgi:hypothetical protein